MTEHLAEPRAPTSEPSWWLKLERAKEHLFELDDRIKPYRKTHRYDITETEQDDHGVPSWEYRAFSQLPVDPTIAVVLGDFMFNIRSALDHLAVALVPEERKTLTSFPILTLDPHVSHPGDTEGDTRRRKIWKKATRGMSDEAVAVLRSFQPFESHPPGVFDGIPMGPDDTVLGVLLAFQNADKHRNLVTMVEALDLQAVVITDRANGLKVPIDLTPLDPTRMAPKGARIFVGHAQVDVEAEGAIHVAVGVGDNPQGAYRRVPDFPAELLRVAVNIAEALEPLVAGHGDAPTAME